ncbi:MAG: hypothetical protein AB7T49_01590 [Oligoflexales bacterium]
MINQLRMLSICIMLIGLSCDRNEEGKTDSKVEESAIQDQESFLQVKASSNLPECAEEMSGTLVYVKDEAVFYTCTANEWVLKENDADVQVFDSKGNTIGTLLYSSWPDYGIKSDDGAVVALNRSGEYYSGLCENGYCSECTDPVNNHCFKDAHDCLLTDRPIAGTIIKLGEESSQFYQATGEEEAIDVSTLASRECDASGAYWEPVKGNVLYYVPGPNYEFVAPEGPLQVKTAF